MFVGVDHVGVVVGDGVVVAMLLGHGDDHSGTVHDVVGQGKGWSGEEGRGYRIGKRVDWICSRASGISLPFDTTAPQHDLACVLKEGDGGLTLRVLHLFNPEWVVEQ